MVWQEGGIADKVSSTHVGGALRTVGEQAAPALPGAMLPQAHHAVRENGIDGVGGGLC